MAVIDPASAISAKIKSQYGKRLREKDYQAMVKCGSVGEVVQYLKTYTHYQSFLDKVSNDVHRGNLENIMRQKQFESFLSFCRYNNGDTPVTKYGLRLIEIRELMKFITLLSIKRPEEYLFSMPLFFVRHTDIGLEKLSLVNNHRELLNTLDNTGYYDVIKGFPPNENGDYDLAAIEDALENYNLSLLYADLQKIKKKKIRNQMLSLFDTLSDYHNYSRIIRLKKYYHMNSDAVRGHLLHYGNLTGRKLDRILSRDTYEEVREELVKTGVGKKAKTIDIDREMAVQGRYEMCRHQLYFSTNPEIVLLSFYILSQTELSNVIAIIEGVRYSMDPESIYETLVL